MTEYRQITAFFFTHQDRLRTSIIKKFNEMVIGDMRSSIGPWFDKKAQFFNGCILYLKLKKKNGNDLDDQWTFELSMVYEGDPAARSRNKRYFKTSLSENPNDILFQKLTMNLALDSRFLVNLHINPADLDNNTIYNLFFMRHGQAEHNVKFVYNPRINTELTNAGKQQARDAGNFWAKWAEQNGIFSIDYFCVSDLLRTQQTAAMFLFGVQNYTYKNPQRNVGFNPETYNRLLPTREEYPKDYWYTGADVKRFKNDAKMDRNQKGGGSVISVINTNNLKVIVLPCLHELEKGTDDGSVTALGAASKFTSALTLGATSGVVSRENITNCRNKSYGKRIYEASGISTRDCSYLPSVTNPNFPTSINLPKVMDWSYYNNFYKGYRDQITFGGRDSCRNTHFLGLFFNIIHELRQSQGLAQAQGQRYTDVTGPITDEEYNEREVPAYKRGELTAAPNPIPYYDKLNRTQLKIDEADEIREKKLRHAIREGDIDEYQRLQNKFNYADKHRGPLKIPQEVSPIQERGTGGGGPVQMPVKETRRKGWWPWGGGNKHKKTRKSNKSTKTRKNRKNNKQGKR